MKVDSGSFHAHLGTLAITPPQPYPVLRLMHGPTSLGTSSFQLVNLRKILSLTALAV